MKLTTKCRYSLRLLLDLAIHASEEKPRMLKDIAETQGLSEKYLSLLVIDLRQAGFISSVRGAGGGYRLAKQPHTITLIDLLEVMEGPVGIVECLLQPDCCPKSNHCPTQILWEQINRQIRSIFAQYSLQNLLDVQHAGNFTVLDYDSFDPSL